MLTPKGGAFIIHVMGEKGHTFSSEHHHLTQAEQSCAPSLPAAIRGSRREGSFLAVLNKSLLWERVVGDKEASHLETATVASTILRPNKLQFLNNAFLCHNRLAKTTSGTDTASECHLLVTRLHTCRPPYWHKWWRNNAQEGSYGFPWVPKQQTKLQQINCFSPLRTEPPLRQ